MSLTSPSFILLALLCAAIWLFGGPANKAVKRAEMELGADDLKTFRERHRRKASRADMPSRFRDIAEASDRAARIWLWSAVAVIAALVWIIATGPGLGLFPYP
jgi:hypothetical protein